MDEKTDPPPPNSTLTPHSKVTLFVGVPITLIILGIALWALLSGMPFATDSKKLTRTEQPAPAVVNEQSGTTATTSQIQTPEEPRGAGRGIDVISTTTTAAPPSVVLSPPPQTATRVQATPVPAPVAPPPVITTQPSVTTTAPARRPPPPAARASQTPGAAPPAVTTAPPQRLPPPVARPSETSTASASEITESQAEDIVRQYVASSDYYGTSADCVGASSQGYKNRGYVIHIVDRCGDRGRLGRWRVDSVTREVFVQKADGRYLRP